MPIDWSYIKDVNLDLSHLTVEQVDAMFTKMDKAELEKVLADLQKAKETVDTKNAIVGFIFKLAEAVIKKQIGL